MFLLHIVKNIFFSVTFVGNKSINAVVLLHYVPSSHKSLLQFLQEFQTMPQQLSVRAWTTFQLPWGTNNKTTFKNGAFANTWALGFWLVLPSLERETEMQTKQNCKLWHFSKKTNMFLLTCTKIVHKLRNWSCGLKEFPAASWWEAKGNIYTRMS